MATRRGDASRLRIPPHSIDAEKAVLGGLMIAPDAWERVADKLVEDDFYQREHRAIFRAIAELSAKSIPCDAVTLAEWFEANGIAELVGGAGYVVRLANAVPSAANIIAYAEIVRDKASLRRLIQASADIATDALQPRIDVIEAAEKRLFEITEEGVRSRGEPRVVAESVKSAYAQILRRREKPSGVTGLPIGFTELDQVLFGLQPSNLIVIAARPPMGKTALALNMAEHASVNLGITSVVFSMEMTSVQLTTRLLASLGGISKMHLMAADLHEDEWSRLVDAASQLYKSPLYIDETPALSPLELASRARRLKREHNLGLVVIDYLQLMQAPSAGENRNAEITEISRGLKALAKELNVPVVALSQLNRSLERRDDKRPIMSDLRESGAIEQDADVILFIYRDDKHNPDSDKKGQAEIIIGRHRNGETGKVELLFRGGSGAVSQHGCRFVLVAARRGFSPPLQLRS